MLPIILTACATTHKFGESTNPPPEDPKEYYVSQRAAYYEQKDKNLCDKEARGKAEADYNLFSDPVTGKVP